MQPLSDLAFGLSVALQPGNALYAVLGCVIGTVVGVLPGIGPIAAVSLLLPGTFGLDATRGVILLGGVYYGAMYGGSTTSILLRIPGEAASVVTCLDGYAMAQKGRAGPALMIAAVGSFVAGTLAVVGLMFLTPALARLALRFGPPEYAALLILGFVAIGYMSGGSMLKALLMAALGLILGTIGIDLSGHQRFTYGVAELGDGIGVVPVAVGLFGLAEILATAGRKLPPKAFAARLRDLPPSAEEWRASAGPIARGTVVGFLIGAVPGPAHIIASFASYALERRLSRHPERFGQGAIEGVAGPEAANNAAAEAAFAPMLALGVPSNAIMAIMMAAMMIHGVTPGPMLLREHPGVFWGFIASMYVGNLVLLILNLPLVGLFATLLRIPYRILYPLIVAFCVLGVYAVNGSVVEVWIMAVMGLAGWALRKLDYEPAPLVIGLVLAPIFEMSLRQSLILSGGSYVIFLQRPLAASLLGLAGGLLLLALVPLVRRLGTAGPSPVA
ncbi:MAG: tripartite tricarboxylate transporter permease [Candidatus Rokubacteria bacterium]|nr:tripartite tricarboxylate transporter permease [Candidatus Rokubacteria bacterium]